MGQRDILQEIQNYPGKTSEYIRSLFKEETEEILKKASIVKVRAGKRFITQNEKIDGIYILVAGKVCVFEEYPTGNMYIFQENTAPTFFGEMEIFAEMDSFIASLFAKTDCVLVVVPVGCYAEFIQAHPEAFYERAKIDFQLLVKSGRENRLYMQLDGKERIKMYLIQRYEKLDSDDRCVLRITKQKIADEIGFSLRTVQRALKKLNEENFIELAGHKILVSEEQYMKMADTMELVTGEKERQTALRAGKTDTVKDRKKRCN